MRQIVCIVWMVVVIVGGALGQQPAAIAQQQQRPEGKLLFLVEAKYADSSWAAMS
jgi:hypothetical protein